MRELQTLELFNICIRGLDAASMVLVILDGTDADSGSCFEVGYAFKLKTLPSWAYGQILGVVANIGE
ncbi:MAG: nucleoside 2-deoxyribosyltransferase [Tatlockia sp.]|nr:nucleoside 2-deoxyribosyltransferase [Tatlockia sp.]